MQNLSGSNIGEDANNVRDNLRMLATTELPEKDREAGRTEVLPVQWRKHLRLDVRQPLLATGRLCCYKAFLQHVIGPQASALAFMFTPSLLYPIKQSNTIFNHVYCISCFGHDRGYGGCWRSFSQHTACSMKAFHGKLEHACDDVASCRWMM